jgi:serine/threonine protein kinase
MKETSHPFVLKFIEEFVFKRKNQCIITEFAPGGDLESQIRKKSFTEDETMIYLTMLLLGLHYLHCKGIIHNEFKPGNILIDQLLDGF